MLVKELFEQVNFEAIMQYLFNEKQIIYDIEDLKEKTQEEIQKKCESMKEAYQHAYNEILKISPEINKNKIIILQKEKDLFSEEEYYDVSLLHLEELNDDSPVIYAIDFISWKQILGYEISLANLEEYSLDKLAGEILWEMTFYGYQEEVIEEEKTELLNRREEVEKAMEKEKDEDYCLNKLKEVLENNIPKQYYSIRAYSEEAICIEKQDSEWIVYCGERGNKYDIKSFSIIKEACFDLISRVSENEEIERKMKDLFDFPFKTYSAEELFKDFDYIDERTEEEKERDNKNMEEILEWNKKNKELLFEKERKLRKTNGTNN